jgi:hypothetical protein
MSKLQVEAYQSLGLTPPMTSDMGSLRRSGLAPSLAQEIFNTSAGDVTRLQVDGSGFTLYKVRSRR